MLISKLDNNCKIIFKPDTSKPSQEVLFSRKKINSNLPNHKPEQYSNWMANLKMNLFCASLESLQ